MGALPRSRGGRRRPRSAAYAHAGRLSILAIDEPRSSRRWPSAAEFEAADVGARERRRAWAADAIGDAYTGDARSARPRSAAARPRETSRAAARRTLLAVGRRQEVMREPNPAAVDWRSQAALAHAALGRARMPAIALAREELELARRFGAPRAIGIALRTLGVVGGDLRRARAEAVDSPRRLAAPGSSTRARSTDLGVALRHRRRIVDAREPLRRALDLGDALRRRAARRARADRAADRGRATAPADS